MPSLIAIRGPIGAGKTTTMHAVREGLTDCTALEADAIKRMLDPTKSSQWRREMAERTTYRLAHELLLKDRSVVAETHSRWPHQTEHLAVAAWRVPNAKFFSFLVTAPLDVCMERALKRDVADISYPIDEAMVKDYYTGLEPRPGEMTLDTSNMTPKDAAKIIIENVLHCTQQSEA